MRPPLDSSLNKEFWRRLARGKDLENLGCSLTNGRIDLGGLRTPVDSVEIKNVTWKALDFAGCRLNGLRLLNSYLIDCVFDECSCKDWRMWGTTILNSTFRSTDLRESSLGGVDDGKRNVFRGVSFVDTDLRNTANYSAEFVGCSFVDTNLDGVDFHGSTFTDCKFEGELREVLFYRHAFRGEAFPANEMDGVDFTRASLRAVEFRGLDLERVRFPVDSDHIVIENWRKTLDRLVGALKARNELGWRQLVAVLSLELKWAGVEQRRGVLNKKDLEEMVGTEGLAEFLDLLRRTA